MLQTKPLCCKLNLYAANYTSIQVSKETPPSVWPGSEEQISEINSGEYPGGLVEGTFPGVNPNDPDGTSWMIGMLLTKPLCCELNLYAAN